MSIAGFRAQKQLKRSRSALLKNRQSIAKPYQSRTSQAGLLGAGALWTDRVKFTSGYAPSWPVHVVQSVQLGSQLKPLRLRIEPEKQSLDSDMLVSVAIVIMFMASAMIGSAVSISQEQHAVGSSVKGSGAKLAQKYGSPMPLIHATSSTWPAEQFGTLRQTAEVGVQVECSGQPIRFRCCHESVIGNIMQQQSAQPKCYLFYDDRTDTSLSRCVTEESIAVVDEEDQGAEPILDVCGPEEGNLQETWFGDRSNSATKATPSKSDACGQIPQLPSSSVFVGLEASSALEVEDCLTALAGELASSCNLDDDSLDETSSTPSVDSWTLA
jgi:hypothetical protein